MALRADASEIVLASLFYRGDPGHQADLPVDTGIE